jgi:hypothetical protein
MRDDNIERRGGMSTTMIAVLAAIAVFALLFLWAPWSGPRVANNTAPGTTVGTTNRPAAPVAPIAPAPTTPTAPSTTR